MISKDEIIKKAWSKYRKESKYTHIRCGEERDIFTKVVEEAFSLAEKDDKKTIKLKILLKQRQSQHEKAVKVFNSIIKDHDRKIQSLKDEYSELMKIATEDTSVLRREITSLEKQIEKLDDEYLRLGECAWNMFEQIQQLKNGNIIIVNSRNFWENECKKLKIRLNGKTNYCKECSLKQTEIDKLKAEIEELDVLEGGNKK